MLQFWLHQLAFSVALSESLKLRGGEVDIDIFSTHSLLYDYPEAEVPDHNVPGQAGAGDGLSLLCWRTAGDAAITARELHLQQDTLLTVPSLQEDLGTTLTPTRILHCSDLQDFCLVVVKVYFILFISLQGWNLLN